MVEWLEIPIALAQTWMGGSKIYHQKRSTLFSLFNRSYLDKKYRKSHWVGHYKLKELDTNDLFKRKNTNEAMEYELTEMDSRSDNLAVMLMKIPQLILEKNKAQKHIKKIFIKDIDNIDTY